MSKREELRRLTDAAMPLAAQRPWSEITYREIVATAGLIALIFALFSSGLKLDRALRWRAWSSVARLLAFAMPLTMAGIALFGSLVLGLSLGAALLLGAILAPTDPVLAGITGSRAVALPKTGHASPIEQPAAVATAIADFLADTAASAS